MASKARKRDKRRRGANLFHQVQRNLEKGHYRQALKDARVCYRQEPTAEHRQFLEHAAMGRAQELHRAGLREECRRVLKSLLALGVTEPAVAEALPRLLVLAGLGDLAVGDAGEQTPETNPGLVAVMADQAVLRPDESPALPDDVRGQARAVRDALEALSAGDEAKSLRCLHPIPRQSHLADWKWFVRGLAAFYRRDRDAMHANWNRLDRTRMAHRIVQRLTPLADPGRNGRRQDDPDSRIDDIERDVYHDPVLAILKRLQANMAADGWERVPQDLRAAYKELEAAGGDLVDCLSEAVYRRLVRQGGPDQIDRLKQVVRPLAIDPNWHRAKALACDLDDDIRGAYPHWLEYLKDLKTLPALTGDERVLARALVWSHVGENFGVAARQHDRFCHDPDCELVEVFQRRAIRGLRKSISLAPQRAATYELLASIHEDAGDEEQAAATFQQLVAQHPDHLAALLFLANHYRQRDEPFVGQGFAERALRIKPLDADIIQLATRLHMAAARHFVRRKDAEAGRAEFAAAARTNPACRETYEYLACRAVFEYAVGNLHNAEQLTARAKGRLAQPTAVLLVLAIESIRYGLAPKAADAFFEHEWKEALKRRCHSETAGQMARVMQSLSDAGVKYPRRAKHVRAVLDYLRRCGRVRWQVEDLRHVCEFLSTMADGSERLLVRFINKGRKKFPDDTYFPLLAGCLELQRGPARCDRHYARSCFELALKLAHDSNRRADQDMVENAKGALTLLNELGDPEDEREPFAGDGPADKPHCSLEEKSPAEMIDAIIDLFEAKGVDLEEIVARTSAEFGDEPEFVQAVRKAVAKRKRGRKKQGQRPARTR